LINHGHGFVSGVDETRKEQAQERAHEGTCVRFIPSRVRLSLTKTQKVGARARVCRKQGLVVDDEPPVREFLTRWLQDWGYAVKQAASASEALEVMLVEPASIMLCDIRMPGHDGLWLAEQVRARWPQTAVIMATAVTDMPTVLKSRHLGAVDYVTKPFGREMLRQAIRRATATVDQ